MIMLSRLLLIFFCLIPISDPRMPLPFYGGCAHSSEFADASAAAADSEKGKGSLRLGETGKNYLDVTVSGARGKVNVAPLNAACTGADGFCSYGFDPGTAVILKAEATALNSRFAGWIGNCEAVLGEENSCRIVMDESSKKITAVFDRVQGIPFRFSGF